MVVDWKVEVVRDLLLPQALVSQEDRRRGDSVLWELEEGVRRGPVGLRLFFPSLMPGSLSFGTASLEK